MLAKELTLFNFSLTALAMSVFPEDLQKFYEPSSNAAMLHLAGTLCKSVARVFQEVILSEEFCLKMSHYIKTKLTFSMIELDSVS